MPLSHLLVEACPLFVQPTQDPEVWKTVPAFHRPPILIVSGISEHFSLAMRVGNQVNKCQHFASHAILTTESCWSNMRELLFLPLTIPDGAPAMCPCFLIIIEHESDPFKSELSD
jgi:hypothetical protein